MKKINKRIIALLLCVLMAFAGPVGVFAETNENGETIAIEEVDNTEAVSEEDSISSSIENVEQSIENTEEAVTDATTETVEQTVIETEGNIGCAECGIEEGHLDTCSYYVAPEPTVYEQLKGAQSVEEMYMLVLEFMNNQSDALMALTAAEIATLRTYIFELDPENDDADTQDLLNTLAILPNGEEELNGDPEALAPSNNVHNVTKNTWYATLSAAVSAAANGNIIEVYNSFTETTSVKIQKQNLTIRAADGYNPTISWTKTDSVPVTNATSYHCVVIYTDVTTSTTFGGGSGTLTFDASKASDDDNKGTRARVLVHCGKGTLNLKDGIVLTGGNTGGYLSGKNASDAWHGTDEGQPKLNEHYEIIGSVGNGAGIYMYSGTLNMTGGVITKNYSLKGLTSNLNALNEKSHNFVGGGAGIYLNAGTTLNLSGGTISYNEAGSGGGGGVLVGQGATLNMTGGTIAGNKTNFASGGGIGVQQKYKKISISGGTLSNNYAEGHGGGFFARGDSDPVQITGGEIIGNKAGSYGGGVLFWTVGSSGAKNQLIIGGSVKISNNEAMYGGGVSVGREVLEDVAYGSICYLDIRGGTIENNTASASGGGIYLQSDNLPGSIEVNTVTITGGTIKNNEAGSGGGGVYVPKGTVNISGGNFCENKALGNSNGGGFLIDTGTLTISGGTFESNNAGNDGGAVYLNNGKVTMTGGSITGNTVPGNGGGLYVNGGTFTMISGSLTKNQATGNTSYGGGAYVTDGDIIIGVKDCTYADPEGNHTVTHTDKKHPVISENSAEDSGGGLAVVGDGGITMHCGKITENTAPNRGRGLNVYMEEGTFDFNNGDLGSLGEPELVIVGGTLDVGAPYINLEYYHCNNNSHVGNHIGKLDKMSAAATKDEFIHLPDGEKYWDAEEGTRFFGWTFFGPDNDADKKKVRSKSDYQPSGTPIKVTEDIDGSFGDKAIHMYALWAPEVSKITYVGGVINGEYVSEKLNHTNDTEYVFHVESQKVVIEAPVKDGYVLKGWYIYQDEGQNANWGYEPVYKEGTSEEDKNYGTLDYANVTYLEISNADGSYELEMGTTLFGDITLIANWEPAYTDLTIVKKGADTIDVNQSFLFQIQGTPDDTKLEKIDMTVTIQGNGSINIQKLPVGEYTVTELTDWSWRYSADKVSSVSKLSKKSGTSTIFVTLNDPDQIEELIFTNSRTENQWFSDDGYAENWWSDTGVIRRDH